MNQSNEMLARRIRAHAAANAEKNRAGAIESAEERRKLSEASRARGREWAEMADIGQLSFLAKAEQDRGPHAQVIWSGILDNLREHCSGLDADAFARGAVEAYRAAAA